MKRLLGRSGRSAMVIPIGAAVAVLGIGGAYAIASSTNTVTACVHKKGGGLYLGRCAHGDRTLSWSIRGPRGPQGIPGPTASSWAAVPITGLSAGSPVTVDLTSGGGEIHTTFPTRIQVSATATYFVPTGSAGQYASVDCFLSLLNNGTTSAMGGSEVSIPPEPAANEASFGTVAVDASKDVPAGTYNVKLTCQLDSVNSSSGISPGGEGGDLNVIAIKR